MFSGLIQYLCPVQGGSDQNLKIGSPRLKTKTGESIAINGVCLTVTQIKKSPQKHILSFDLSPETISKTNLKDLLPGSLVNMERCLTLTDLLGGHLVQGHVDGVGKVVQIKRMGGNREIWFKGPASVMRYIVPKGSVAINGVSLTAVKVTSRSFSVALIPFTLKHTNLGLLKIGDPVNLEADVIAKYIEKFTRK